MAFLNSRKTYKVLESLLISLLIGIWQRKITINMNAEKFYEAVSLNFHIVEEN